MTVIMASVATDVSAADRTSRALPASIEGLRLAQPVATTGRVSRVEPALLSATDTHQVFVRLRTMPAARVDESRPADQVMQRERVRLEQAQFRSRAARHAPRARIIASVENVLNGVFMEVDAAQVRALAADPAVERVSRVVDYQLDLTETVPYVRQQEDGPLPFTGRGISVAVLDSGIDYTHKAFGGPGTPEFYQECYAQRDAAPTGNCARYFGRRAPKVIDGYDFVGEDWPNGPLAPDPNPIDFQGHGTNVADIVAGRNGVARDAKLVAVKTCSAVSSSCSGIALIQGLEFAVDPNGDGDFKDRVDIINMSLGGAYGQPFDDDLAFAVDSATALGVLTVASAGNSGDKPYATGTPGAAATALSVAQTAVPSAALPLMQILAPANLAGNVPAVFQPWSVAPAAAIEAPVQSGNGAGGNLLGCDAFAPGSLAGKIVLVDRGSCGFSVKIANIGAGGGIAGIIGLVASGDPFEGGFGGGDVTIPGYMISQANANRLRAGLPNTVVRFDPAVAIPLRMSMVGSSSRGPQNDAPHMIKPEIGAPGASVSAIAGSGDGVAPFGGTSGAAPMVAGAAAVLLEAAGGTKATAKGTPPGKAFGLGLRPIEVKALLMNNAEPNIINDPLAGTLAPITRIGAGELRVRDAVNAPVAAWDAQEPQAALSFGFVDVAGERVAIERTVRVRNYSKGWRSYKVTPTFRFADDVANGAVSVSAPKVVTVGPGRGRDTLFKVRLTIDGAKLRGNFMSSGSQGANPAALTTNEYDGYLVLDDGRHQLQLPWHVLPRKAARVVPSTTTLAGGTSTVPQVIGLNNAGVGTAQNDAYALIATSPQLLPGGRGEQAPMPSIRAVGVNTFPVPAGFCSANPSFLWAFAVNTWVRQEHLLPVSHQVYLDTNQDGTDDYVVLNRDFSGLGTLSDGRQLSWVVNLATGSASAFFFAEHSTSTGNTVLLICGEQIGMNAANLLTTQVDMDVFAQDFYFGGPGDLIEDLTVTPLGERFFGQPVDVAGKGSGALEVYDFGTFPGNTEELGLMLFTNGDRGTGNRGGATQDTEAILFRVAP